MSMRHFSYRRIVIAAIALWLGFGQPRCLLAHDVFQTLPYATLGIGTRSGCARGAKIVVADAAEWRRVWSAHTRGLANPSQLPKVDFAHQVVLVLLNGQAPRGTSIEVAQVVQGPQATLVYYFVNQDAVAPGHQATAQPFHFAVIDKPVTPIRFVDAVGRTCSDCGK